MGIVFNVKNSQFLNQSLLTECTRPKSACSKSSSCRFSFSATRNAISKATEYVTFSFSYRILVFFPFQESLNATICKRQEFSNVLAAIIRKNSTNDLGLRMMKALLFIHQPDRVAPNARDVSTDWRYQTLVKKYRIFSRVLLLLFSELEILV